MLWRMKLPSDVIFDNDEPLVQKVFDEMELPKDVLGLGRERGEDSDGEPVWWIWVSVPDEPRPSPKDIRRFAEFSNRLRDKLIEAGLQARPYVRFHECKPRIRRNAAGR